MSKRDLEKLFDDVQDLAERLGTPEEELSGEEVASFLVDAGIDTERLRSRLHEAARSLANRQRALGKPAPRHLEQAVEQTGPMSETPKDRATAVQKFRQWIDSFGHPVPVPRELAMIRSYRKSTDLSPEDEAQLEELEEELKHRLAEEDEGQP